MKRFAHRDAYPFAAIAGNHQAKLALMMLAVDPALKGALICGRPGEAKSAMARSFAAMLCLRLIETPLGATADRLLGGLDIEATLRYKKRRSSRGLMAEAHGGALYIDDINLLESDLIHLVADALDRREVRVEREGISEILKAEFFLIGTYNPAEGEADALLKDRVGFIVEAEQSDSIDDRAELLSRIALFDSDPARFNREFEIETARIKSNIEEARKLLHSVRITQEDIRNLADAAVRLGVKGNRADLFAVRAARAHAALNRRDELIDEDLIIAIRLALIPRANVAPAESDLQNRPSTQKRDDSESEIEATELDRAGNELIEDMIIQAADARAPDDLLRLPHRRNRSASAGRRVEARNIASGRYAGTTTRRAQNARVAIDATLRAAAPHQPSRRRGGSVRIKADDLRYKKFKRRSGVLFIFAIDTSSSMAVNRLAQAKGAMTRLLKEAYLHRDRVALVSFRGEGAEVLLHPTRSVELGRRVVESMPAGGATPIAKGVLRSIEVARLAQSRDRQQTLLLLFTDGRANVGAGGERRRSEIEEELRQLGAVLQREGIASVVVDTRSKFVSSGEGESLAAALGGRYVYLPRADSNSIHDAISKAAAELRE
ncbi:MAG: magnesium chelatase ATPase subunit D [Acidobacteriota bacterium]